MTSKRELISALSVKTQETQATCELVIEALADIIISTVREGKEIKIPRIGKFDKTYRKARRITNIRKQGEFIELPPAYSVRFKPSTSIKQILNNK